jgi:hypothetical protein
MKKRCHKVHGSDIHLFPFFLFASPIIFPFVRSHFFFSVTVFFVSISPAFLLALFLVLSFLLCFLV